MKKSKSSVLIQLAAVLIASAVHFYWTWPTYAFNLFYEEADSTVKTLSDNSLQIEFFNKFQSKEISFTRQLIEGEKARLNAPVLRVRYARTLPDEVIICRIDKIPALWLPVVVHLTFLFTIVACCKEAAKTFSLRT